MLLTNHTGETSKIGHTVIIDPNDSQSFIYSSPNSTNIVGVICESVPKYAVCEIATSGTTKVYVYERVAQGSIIRAQKSTDNISRGTCKTRQSSDASYFQIGTALESGKGLIKCALNLSYNGSRGGVANGTYIVGWGMSTDGTITIENGIIVNIIEST